MFIAQIIPEGDFAFIMEYSFNMFNSLAANGLIMTMSNMLTSLTTPPIVLCIGSDLAIGDSLGPITGTLINQKRSATNAFVYGTLKKPVTAKEVKYLREFLKKTHPDAKVIAIDAAVGNAGDIGLIKINNRGLKPGAGANKKFAAIGDISIMGIVAEKSMFNYSLLNLTRLNLVYKMADIISDAIATFLSDCGKSCTDIAI